MLPPGDRRSRQLFALVDCNSFYVSCEQLFNPRLAGRPVVVLSNNDGCVVSRSSEARALGIGMGVPFFKCERLLRRHGGVALSSNYALYGDMSQRVMDVLQQFEAEVEIYSIDEAFLALPADGLQDLAGYGRRIRNTVRRLTGIPVSIGFGPTKTLAKLANRLAKKHPGHGGVLDISRTPDRDALLAAVAVRAVWGIGSRSAKRLATQGIHTALALKNANDTWIRKQLTVTGLRTVMELRGISCIPLADAAPAKQSITSSRSFGRPVELLADLREALSTYTAIAAEKLRQQQAVAGCLHVFLSTNRFKQNEPRYAGVHTITLAAPSASTPVLVKYALEGLAQLYRPSLRYQKTGIILTELLPRQYRQQSLFPRPDTEQMEVMQAVDRINQRWGRDTIQYAGAGLAKSWKNRQLLKSPAYTSSWQEIPVVKAAGPREKEELSGGRPAGIAGVCLLPLEKP